MRMASLQFLPGLVAEYLVVLSPITLLFYQCLLSPDHQLRRLWEKMVPFFLLYVPPSQDKGEKGRAEGEIRL